MALGVLQVTYDSADVSYDRLLDVFFEKHNPTQLNGQGGDVGTQYRSGIYYHTPEQKAAAEAKLKELAAAFPVGALFHCLTSTQQP